MIECLCVGDYVPHLQAVCRRCGNAFEFPVSGRAVCPLHAGEVDPIIEVDSCRACEKEEVFEDERR